MKYCVKSQTTVSETKRVTEERFTDNFDEALHKFALLYLNGGHDLIHVYDNETGEIYISYDSYSGDVWMSEPTVDHLNQVIERKNL